MNISEVYCKKALAKSHLPEYEYALNPYYGCLHACVYCYAPYVLHEKRDWGSFIDIKRNVPDVLVRELYGAKKLHIGIGTVTDAYQSIEKTYELTRLCLQQIKKYQFPISIQTKSPLVLRDLDILSNMKCVDIGITITSYEDNFFEHGAPNVSERFACIEKLVEKNISVWLFVGPFLPYITEKSLDSIIKFAKKTNIQLIFDKLRLKNNLKTKILKVIEKKYSEYYENYVKIFKGEIKYYEIIIPKIHTLCKNYAVKYHFFKW